MNKAKFGKAFKEWLDIMPLAAIYTIWLYLGALGLYQIFDWLITYVL